MPGINAKATPIIPRNRPYPPSARDAARTLRGLNFPGAQQIAQGFEYVSNSLDALHKATRENAPEIEDFLITDEATGRVLAALGQYEKNGVVRSGGYFGELYAGDPYGDSDPAYAILSVTTDGKVQIGQNGWIDVLDPFGESAAWIGTQADRLAVTGAANNGSGLIRLEVLGHPFATSDSVRVWEVGGVPNATGVFTLTKIDADHVDLQNSVFVGTYTSGGYVNRLLHITGAADNGSGLIRLTTAVAHTYESGDKVNVASVGGVPNATGQFILDAIDSTHFDLVGSTFAGAYTSGGVCLRYFAGMLAQTIAIGESFADYKLRAFANGDLRLRNAVITLTSTVAGITHIIELDPDPFDIHISVTSYDAFGGSEVLMEDGELSVFQVDSGGIMDPDGSFSFLSAGILQVDGATGLAGQLMARLFAGATANGPRVYLQQKRGTRTSPSATQSGDLLGEIEFAGSGTVTGHSAAVRAFATENHSAGAQGAKLVFEITPDGASTPEDAVIVDQSGNVGIGTSTPARRLHLLSSLSSTSPGMQIESTDTGGRAYAVLSTASGSSAGVGRLSLYDVAANVHRLVLDSTGKVGIANVSPAYPLDVTGNINSSTGYRVGGTAGVTGALTIGLTTANIQYKDWAGVNQSITVVTNVGLTANAFTGGIRTT